MQLFHFFPPNIVTSFVIHFCFKIINYKANGAYKINVVSQERYTGISGFFSRIWLEQKSASAIASFQVYV